MEFKPQVPFSEIRQRVAKLRAAASEAGLDAVFLAQPVDLYYYSGTGQSAYLYLPVAGDPILLVRRSPDRARQESPLEVVAIQKVSQVPQLVREMTGSWPRKCGLEFDILPVREYFYYQSLFPGTVFEDASPLVLNQRAIKSDWEIGRMEEAGRVSSKAFQSLRERLAPGWTELEAAAAIEAAARAMGHEGKLRIRHFRAEGYPGHLLSGPNGSIAGALDSPATGRGPSAAFPFGAGHRRIRPDEPVMVDFACVVEGYHMDETRMFAAGQMPAAARDATLAAAEIYHGLLDYLRPGLTCHQVFSRAVEIAAAIGWQEEFLGLAETKARFVGHGIGLELVEPPLLAEGRQEILEPGMVFAIEPKMVVRDGFIAGVENVVRLTGDGAVEVSLTPLEIFLSGNLQKKESLL